MPKQIKKKVVKQDEPENELRGVVEKIRGYYSTHKREALIAEVVIVSIVILTITAWGYVTFSKKTSASLQYSGYTSYHNLNTKDDPKAPSQKEQHYKKALDEFQKAYDKSKSPITLFYIASAYYEIGKKDEAEKALIELNKTYAGNEDIIPLSLYKLFELYKNDGKIDKANETLQQLQALRTPIYKDVVLYQMSEILKKQGKEDESKKKLDELEKNYPNSPYVKPKPAQAENKPDADGNKIPINIPVTGTNKNPDTKSVPNAEQKPPARVPETNP
ncbi:MAG: tetratricopeptide repeat protein [Nitrospirae bacterium]|nr:tetratricopeptide repeat protein [Nitrospirota bacterium]